MAEWGHVAVVNYPANQTVTVYVDGAPILRDVLEVTGIQHDDAKPWILGAGLSGETLTDGWNGETRLVTEPLEEDPWLTARATAATPAPSDKPTEGPPTEPSEDPTEEPTSTPTKEPTDLEADPTTEPTEAPSHAVASDEETNDHALVRTGAGVLRLLAAGAGAIILGVVTLMLRRRNAARE